MSKFLKFIVHFVVICTLLCVLALVVPPFFGVTTVIVDDYSKATNLPAGSVTYAIPVKTEEVFMGTPILVQNNGKYYRYNLSSVDLSNHTGGVVDPGVSDATPISVEVKNYLPRILITVGYLGYLAMATRSIEGIIILGLAVLFLIILYVIAEIWKRDKLADQEQEVQGVQETSAGDDLYVKSKKELKREEKAREKRMREEDRELLKKEKARKKEERKNRSIIKTGGFVDEIYEDEMEPEEPAGKQPVNVQTATTEAHELLKKEITAATAEAPSAETPAPAVQAAKKEDVQEEEKKKPAEIKKMAIPLWTASQLAEKARKEGDAPDIMRDPITNVMLFDYSDIIGMEDSDSAKA